VGPGSDDKSWKVVGKASYAWVSAGAASATNAASVTLLRYGSGAQGVGWQPTTQDLAKRWFLRVCGCRRVFDAKVAAAVWVVAAAPCAAMQRAGMLRLLWQILPPGVLRSGDADCRCIAMLLIQQFAMQTWLDHGKARCSR
jgi:hypothetical protein